MKIKSLLIGMLACTALVGCTDEGLENGGTESQKQAELVRGDAYVNFVINTSTNSSRGTTGDTHTDVDDNKHHVNGVREENTVNELLLVIAKVNEDNALTAPEPTLYTPAKIEAVDKVANGYVGYFKAFNETTNLDGFKQDQETKKISLASPIRLDYTGKYAVLVVINPEDELKKKIAEGSNHNDAYNAILAHEGKAYEEENNVKSFQMSNKEVEIIEATAEHSLPSNPKVASIDVERTVSKTTWRPTSVLTNSANSLPADLANMENLYEVKVNVGQATATKANYWFKEAKTEGYDAFYYGYNLNKAKHTNGSTYWVLLNSNAKADGGQITAQDVKAIFLDEFFTKTELSVLNDDNTYTGVIDDQTKPETDDNTTADDKLAPAVGSEETALVLKTDYKTAQELVSEAFVQGLTFDYVMTEGTPDNYYVNLTHYALTNKADKVYAVRHIDNGEKVRAMGVLGSGEWLSTPTLTYGQTLADVNTAAAALKVDEDGNFVDASGLFKKLPTSKDDEGNDIDSDGVTDTEHYDDDDENGDNVGYFMEYLMENAPKENQTADNITGIVLAGNIYDNTGALVPVLYKYNQKYYRSLRALVNAHKSNTFEKDGKTYTITENSTDDQAIEAGIDVYKDGRCFYYSSQIKHFEDGIEDNYGVMEYAIMRNNIYSLAVKTVTEIGDAQLNLTPSTPIEDIRSYVTLEVSILPWIVRFNDIQL